MKKKRSSSDKERTLVDVEEVGDRVAIKAEEDEEL